MPDYHSAYCENYHCETALVKIVDYILWSMEESKVMALMALALSAAFDVVDNSILLKVLQKKFGMEAKCLSWFDTYLRPRHCKVNLGTAYSSEHELQCSISQDSCAGPVVYLAYDITLQEVIPPDIPLHRFADDHSMEKTFRAGSQNNKEEKKTIEDLENGAKNNKTWMDINRLKMNDGKREFALFGSRQQLATCISDSMNVNGTKIDE